MDYGVITFPTWFGRIYVKPEELPQKLLKTVRYFEISADCWPATLPRRKADLEQNGWTVITFVALLQSARFSTISIC